MTVEHVITTQYEILIRIFGNYLRKAGLTDHLTAVELLNEVTMIAMSQPERFSEVREPVAWLIGIGANVIRREQVALAKSMKREPLVRDLFDHHPEMSDAELFDRLHTLSETASEQFESHETATYWLSLLAPADREVIQLAILHGLNGSVLGDALNISPVTARVRLHRALKRLRTAVKEHSQHE